MCNKIFITKSITNTDNVILVPNQSISVVDLGNYNRYRLIIACGVRASATLPVYIQVAEGNIPLLDKYANNIYSNQLRTRYQYCIGYGNDNSSMASTQFIVFNNLCCKCVNQVNQNTQRGEK